jgi:hypothetical protein
MTRGRPHRSALVVGWAAAIAVATLGFTAPATGLAGMPAADPPSYSITVASNLIGTTKPYVFEMTVTNDGNIIIQMTRTASKGNRPQQQHVYSVKGSTLSCQSDLSGCGISDNDALGPLGRIDLAFNPTGQIHTSKSRCTDGTVYRVDKTRTGTLKGIFRIRTHTGYFGTIQNKGTGVRVSAALPAELDKSINKNVTCATAVAERTGPAGDIQCVNGLALQATSEDIAPLPEAAIGFRAGTSAQAFVEVGYKDPDSTDATSIGHLIVGDVPKKTVRETSSDPAPLEEVTINFGSLDPFASGTGRFDPTDPPEFEGDSCNSVSRKGNLNGAYQANFDGWGLHVFSSMPATASRSTAN